MNVFDKALAQIADADSQPDDGPGGFTAILSTPSLDRDGDRLGRSEWIEPLPDRITLDVDHGMTVTDTIGSARPYFDNSGNLMIDATFASTPKAQEVRTLIKEGHINTVSVAFMNDKTKKDGAPNRELLNAGVVAIPSNRDAVILASKRASVTDIVNAGVMTPDEVKKSLGIAESGANALLESFTTKAAGGAGNDGALVQAVHDASVHLGAQCAQPEVIEEDPSGDASGANKGINGPTGTVIDGGIALMDAAEAKAADITITIPEGFTREDFESRLASIFTPESPQGNSPAESEPAEEAATDEVPADEAAEDSAAESEATDWQAEAFSLEMELFALPDISGS